MAAPKLGHCVIWACSNNPESFCAADHRDRIGWAPQDSAEAFRGKVGNVVSGNPVIEQLQGGNYCAPGYSRATPTTVDAFALD